MSANSSSTFNDLLVDSCFRAENMVVITSTMMAVKTVLVLPLSVFVLFLGHQQWWRRSFKSASHSDVFSYHLAAMEFFWGFGFVCFVCGFFYQEHPLLGLFGLLSCSFPYFGEMLFHLLTCVERHLAVVHPVTYLSLRNARGVRIRNISIGCVWLLCFGLTVLQRDISANYTFIIMLSIMGASIVVVTVLSFSVLRVLVRPGPGDGGKEKVDQLKQRAFHTISAISSVLWLWFVGLFVCYAFSKSSVLSNNDACMLLGGVNWLNLPTSLVSPLLYLHRAGKLSCTFFKC